jgi:hypothetical protein
MTAAPVVHICLRQTLDWHDEALASAYIIPRFRPKFEAWNATFTMPYHQFRHRLKDIAQLNFSRVDGAICSSLDDVPAGHLIVPVDDDDWLAPDLAVHLRRAYEEEAAVYRWSRRVLEWRPPLNRLRHGLGRFVGRAEKHVCKTNNYAVRSDRALVPLALNHVDASRFVDAHPADVKRIPVTLSIQNRNLASQTTLAWGRPTIGAGELASLLNQHRRLYARWHADSESRWAEPYVRLMIQLMAEIDVKRSAARDDRAVRA